MFHCVNRKLFYCDQYKHVHPWSLKFTDAAIENTYYAEVMPLLLRLAVGFGFVIQAIWCIVQDLTMPL